MQINFEIMPLEAIDVMTNVQELLLPMVWIEEGLAINKTFVNMLKYQLIL